LTCCNSEAPQARRMYSTFLKTSNLHLFGRKSGPPGLGGLGGGL